MNTIGNNRYFWRQRGLFGDPARVGNVKLGKTASGFVVVPNCCPQALWLSPTAVHQLLVPTARSQLLVPNCSFWRQRGLFGDPARVSNVKLGKTASGFVVVPNCCPSGFVVVPNCCPVPNCSLSPTARSNCSFPTARSQLLVLASAWFVWRSCKSKQCQTGQDSLRLCGCPQLLSPTAVPNCCPVQLLVYWHQAETCAGPSCHWRWFSNQVGERTYLACLALKACQFEWPF